MFETRRRSMAKALSWRGVSLVITTTIAYKVTGRLDLAASVGVVDMLIKVGLFYLHERCWSRVSFGLREPEYQI